jgi:hypothetical protein
MNKKSIVRSIRIDSTYTYKRGVAGFSRASNAANKKASEDLRPDVCVVS